VCHSCGAPIARQEAACWRCGVQCAAQEGPRAKVPALAGGQPAQPMTVLGRAEGAGHMDRWVDEGGSIGRELVPATVTG
jgi:hypothetical protein